VGRAKLTLLALVVVSSVGCDQVTKAIATTTIAPDVSLSYLGGVVRLWNAENPGGFLSLGADLSPIARALIFGGFNTLIVLGGIFYVLRNEEQLRRVEVIALALIVSGALGNLIDRVALGVVRDFMHIGIGPIRTGIFNVADVAAMAGAILLFFCFREHEGS
jgi:signal peptidase II